MKSLQVLLTLVFVVALAVPFAVAEAPCSTSAAVPTNFTYDGSACQQVINFAATPLIDGSATTYYLPGNANQQIVSLYGIYGNNESTSSYGQWRDATE